jgi:hypothetical protein
MQVRGLQFLVNLAAPQKHVAPSMKRVAVRHFTEQYFADMLEVSSGANHTQ